MTENEAHWRGDIEQKIEHLLGELADINRLLARPGFQAGMVEGLGHRTDQLVVANEQLAEHTTKLGTLILEKEHKLVVANEQIGRKLKEHDEVLRGIHARIDAITGAQGDLLARFETWKEIGNRLNQAVADLADGLVAQAERQDLQARMFDHTVLALRTFRDMMHDLQRILELRGPLWDGGAIDEAFGIGRPGEEPGQRQGAGDGDHPVAAHGDARQAGPAQHVDVAGGGEGAEQRSPGAAGADGDLPSRR
jgi:hypothetical protein